jgi:hypothetical protein
MGGPVDMAELRWGVVEDDREETKLANQIQTADTVFGAPTLWLRGHGVLCPQPA